MEADKNIDAAICSFNIDDLDDSEYVYDFEDIKDILDNNGINIPGMRDALLMKDEDPYNAKHDNIEADCVVSLCASVPFWTPAGKYDEDSELTGYLVRDSYLVRKKDEHGNLCTYVRWDRIHGKKRKILKTFIRNEKKHRAHQVAVWDKYVGREDVAYIYVAIGDNNWWSSFHKQVINQPWFLEKVDNRYDRTYCEIYVKIDPNL